MKILISKMISESISKLMRFKFLLFIAVLVLLGGLAAFWRFIPLANYLETDKLLALKLQLSTSPLAPFLAIAIYVIGGLVVFPVFILIPVTALIFGPMLGCLYSLLGILANASVLYLIGHVGGHDTVNRLTGSRVNKLSQQLASRSFFTIITLRFFPIAPFTIINLISGASHIRFRDYIFGTLIGISPAIVIMTLLENQLERTVRNPVSENTLVVIVLAILLLLIALWSKKRFDNVRE